jgi:methionine sulfoxide reductase heme-binding subunit
MKRPRIKPLQILLHIAAWIPLVVLVYDFQNGNLTVNPIQAAMQRTGNIALILLTLSLACTPLYSMFKFAPLLPARRPLGLYAYMYAAIHLLIFSGLDYGFDLGLIMQEVAEKRFILVGMASFLILTVLAVTSVRWWMVRLGKRWKRLHQLVYLVNLMVVLHFAWAVKGDIFTLQGDILRPLLAGIIIITLLILRLPPIRRLLRRQNQRVQRPTPAPGGAKKIN